MPISLHDILTRDTHTITVEWEGETAEIVYRPSRYTPELEDTHFQAIREGVPSVGLARMLAGVLVSWEIVDDNGEPLPTDFETLSRLSTDFLDAVRDAIRADFRVGREDRKNSAAGSPRVEKPGKSRQKSTFS
jgi:hypothetical protein